MKQLLAGRGKTWIARALLLAAAAVLIPACNVGKKKPPPPGTPSAPLAVLATSGESQVTVVWAASAGATSYNLKRATTSGGPYILVANTTNLAFTNTGLTNGTAYFFVVSALNALGEGGNSAEVTATPAQSAVLAPFPLGLTAVPGDQRNFLSWAAALGAASYNLYSAAAVGGPYTLVQNVVGTTFTHTGLTNGTPVFYRVSSVNSVGESAQSTPPVSATPTAPPLAPGAPTLAGTAGDGRVALTWSAPAGSTTYTLLRGAAAGGPYGTTVATGLTTTFFTETGLPNGTAVFYIVRAVNSVGTSPNSNEVAATPTAPVVIPSVPTGLTATPGNGQVSLSWNAAAGATTYTLLRGAVSGGPYPTTVAAGLTTTFFTETGLPNGTAVFYVVRAVNSAGPSANSAQASATPTAPPPPPSVPTGVIATADTTPQVTLTWTASAGATGYVIHRSTGGPFTLLGTSVAATFTDAAVASNTTYSYIVFAVNIGGTSAASAPPASATTPSLAPTLLTALGDNTPRVVLNWVGSAGAVTYNIKRSIAGGAFTQYQNLAATTFNDTLVANNVLYAYRITAVNSGGVESLVSNTASATTPPAAPTGLSAVADATPQVALSWTASVGAATYNIKRSVSGGPFAQYQNVAGTAFNDTVVANNTVYAYQVTAVGTGGESLVSNTATATTPSVAPTGLVAVANNTPQIILSWTGSAGAVTYNIKRAIGAGAFVQYGTSAVTAFADSVVSNATAYSYRVTAVNAGGVESLVSNTSSATTPPAAPVITATPSTLPRVTLDWALVAGATGYRVFRGPAGLEVVLATLGPLAASYPDNAVLNNTQYRYFVIADGVGGASQNSNVVTPLVHPGPPTALGALSTNTPQVNLSWTAPVDGAASYKVFRDGGVIPIVSGHLLTTFSDTGVVDNTGYTYTVVATNATGDSSASNVAGATTPPAPPVITATPSTLPRVTLDWGLVAGATAYRVFRGPVGLEVLLATLGAAATSYPDNAVVNNTQYRYFVIADGAGGASRNSNVVTPLVHPGPPTALGALSTNAPQVNLSWTAPLDGAASYKVFRNGGAVPIATGILVTTYSDTGVADNTAYTYEVRATNATGDSELSNVASVTTPPAPPVITATPSTLPRVTLDWGLVAGATAYRVFRGPLGSEVLLATLGPLAASYPDNTVLNNTQYRYFVIADGVGGASRNSNVVTPLVQPGPPTALGAVSTNAPQVNLSWTAPVDGAASYKVFRTGTVPPIVSGHLLTTFSDTGVVDNTSYTYTVVATNATGDSVASNGAPVTTPPAPPVITATPSTIPRVTLTWGTIAGATAYRVFRGPAGLEVLLATLGPLATSYPDNAVAHNTQYRYLMIADGAGGASRDSNVVTPTVQPAPPTALGLTTTSTPSVILNWTGSLGGATNYKVFKNGGIVPIATVPGTTYTDLAVGDNQSNSYTIVATNAGGDSLSSNTAAITTPPAPPVMNTSVSSGTPQLTLTWSAVAGAVTYEVYNGPIPGSDTFVASYPSTVFMHLQDPGNNTTLYFHVHAVNANGEGRASNEIAITIPPAAPTGLTGSTTAAPLEVVLNWTAPAGGSPSYEVSRSSGGPFTPIGTPTLTTFTDTTVANGTTYSYRVIGTNVGGASPVSNTFTISTAPVAPSGLATVNGNQQIGLSWTGSPGTAVYRIYRETLTVFPAAFALIATSPVVSYTDNTVVLGDTYNYKVTALAPGAGGGESLFSNTAGPAQSNPAVPSAPTLNAPLPGNTQVTLNWSAPAGATFYNVRRATASGGPYTLLTVPGAQTTTNFVDTGRTNGTPYFYVVSAENVSGEGVNSNEGSAVPNAPPGAPSGVLVSANNIPQVTVTWTAGANAASHDVFQIEVGATFLGNFAMPATTHIDGTVTPNTTYFYTVRSQNSVGTSGFAGSPNVTTPPGPPTGVAGTPISGTRIDVAWTAPAFGAGSYKVLRSDNGGPFNQVATGVVGTAFTDNTVVASQSYRYLLIATGAGGDSQSSAPSSAVITPGPLPGTPLNVVATPLNGQVFLTWNNVGGASSYRVKRSLTSGGPHGTVQSLTGNSATDPGLVNGTTYYYVISAVNAIGEGPDSLEVAVVPSDTPPVPTNLVASGGDGRVFLTWNSSPGATSYNVKRSTTSGSGYATIFSPGTNSHIDLTAANGTTYFYVVSAVATFESADSNEDDATPSAPPPVPGGLSATGGNLRVQLGWNVSAGANSYNVKRSTVSGGPYTTVSNPSSNGYTDFGVSNGTTYFYVVSARIDASESADSLQVTATPAATPPTGVVAQAGNLMVNLTWDSMLGAQSYVVKRSLVSGSGYVNVGTPVGNGFTDTGLANGTPYFYVVTAVNSALAETLPSLEVTATPSNAPTVTSTNIPGVGGVNLGFNLRLNFSTAMDRTSTEAAVTIAKTAPPGPAPTGLFFWSAGDQTLTIVFETNSIAGIQGSDLLAENSTYQVTVGTGATSATLIPFAAADIRTFNTFPDATPPVMVSTTPSLLTLLPSGQPTIDVEFSEVMDPGSANVSIRYGFNETRIEGSIPPDVGDDITLSWVNGGMTLRLTFPPLPDRTVGRLSLDDLQDAAGLRFNQDDDIVFVTQNLSGETTLPVVSGVLPGGAVGVSRDSAVFVTFSEPMHPNIVNHVRVTDTSNAAFPGVAFVARLNDSPFGVQLQAIPALPAGTTVKVSWAFSLGAVDAAGNALVAGSTTFTTEAASALAPAVDADFTSFPLAPTNNAISYFSLGQKIAFVKFGTSTRDYINEGSLSPLDALLFETATGAPLKGYVLEVGEGGELEIGTHNNFTGLEPSTGYTLRLFSSLRNSSGVAFPQTDFPFTTAATAAGARPRLFDLETKFSTEPLGVHKADLQISVNTSGAVVTSVQARSQTQLAFNPTLTTSGDEYSYESAGNEANLTTTGLHLVRYTVVTTLHTTTIHDKGFIFSSVPSLTAPANASTTPDNFPTYTWTGVPAGSHGVFLQVQQAGTPVYMTVLPPTATTFTQPPDYPLNPGLTYTWTVVAIHFPEAPLRGGSDQEAMAAPRTFTTNSGPPVAPSVTLTTPGGPQTNGVIQIPYTLFDGNGDLCSLVAEFSLNSSGGPWSPATIAVGPTSGVTSSLAGIGHTLVWNSVADGVAPLVANTTVRFRITPSETLPGVAGETTDFTVNNSGIVSGSSLGTTPVSTMQAARSIASDGTNLYVFGTQDLGGADVQWRIEKRAIVDGSLVGSFGTGGVRTTNPGAGVDDRSLKILIDSTHLYLLGARETANGSGIFNYYLEKRTLDTGALELAFNGTGQLTGANLGQGGPVSMAIDGTSIYLAMAEFNGSEFQGRIEKRAKASGAPDGGFGTAGVIIDHPTAPNHDGLFTIMVDGTHLYVAGGTNSVGGPDAFEAWAQKRLLTTGALVPGFATGGRYSELVVGFSCEVRDIVQDGTSLFLFMLKKDGVGTTWRLEQLDLVAGTLTIAVETNVLGDPEAIESSNSLLLHNGFLYVAGSNEGPGVKQWRLEKRNPSAALGLVASFGTGGVVLADQSAGDDQALGIIVVGGLLHVCGTWDVGGLQGLLDIFWP